MRLNSVAFWRINRNCSIAPSRNYNASINHVLAAARTIYIILIHQCIDIKTKFASGGTQYYSSTHINGIWAYAPPFAPLGICNCIYHSYICIVNRHRD